MLASRAHRGRVPAAAATAVLLGMVFALLLCASSGAAPSPASLPASPGGVTNATPATTVTAATAAVAEQGFADQHAPGCRKGVKDQDNGAHPATPPRGGVGSELLPALHQTGHGASAAGGSLAGVMLDVTPERGPPPLAPPSPMELSILRV